MEYIQMADNLTFSRFALGFWRLMGWNMSVDQLIDYLHQVLDLGITTMDHADIYGHYTVEEYFGKVLKKDRSLRKRMQLVTKCGIVYKGKNGARIKYYDYSKEWIIKQVEQSLEFMGTDYLDVLLLHRPSPMMNPEEIADAFEILKNKEKYFISAFLILCLMNLIYCNLI